jgi:hypothetical protein
MSMTEKGITNRGPKKRDPECFELQHAVLLPKGTILRQDPGLSGAFTAPVAGGTFSVDRDSAGKHPDTYKRVIA